MQIDFKKEIIPLSEMKWNQSATLLVEGDVIVPDIKPDIKEILLAEANAAITGKDCTEGKLNITGTAAIRILYIPDAEGTGPKSIETKFDFKDSLDMPAEEMPEISVKAATEHIEFSLINSRKLNMKVVVSVTARGYNKRELTLLTDVAENAPLKIRKKPLAAYQIVADAPRDIVITEALEVPSTKPDIDEIIKLDAKAARGDCKIMSGKILLKGSLMINTLYNGMDAEAGIQHMEHELSFSEMADIDGLNDDCLCNVTYSVKNVYYTLKEDMNGDPRIISLDVVLRADIMASRIQDVQVIDDCYSTVGEAALQSEHIRLDELLSEGVSHESIKEILTIPEGVPAAGAVYSLQCKPKVQEIQIAGEKMIIRGKLAAFVLYGCADAENPMYSLVGEFDFEHAVPVDGLDENAVCECSVTEQGVSFTLNAASEIELRCVLEFYTRAMKKTDLELMTGCEVSEEETEAVRRGMVIYFAQQGDSLWDIAKRYKTDQDKIMHLNKMEQPQVLPGQKILIPGI
ncbi:MAG: SPOCS domain-containing protein [Clostridia bacterium]